jgi:hypothetical protein
MRASIPAAVREQIASQVTVWTKQARDRYDRTPSKSKASPSREVISVATDRKSADTPPNINIGPLSFVQSNAPGQALTVSETSKTGQLRVLVPRNHELAAMFRPRSGEDGDLRKLCLAALAVVEAVFEKRMKVDRIPMAALRRAFYRYL